MLCLSCVLVVSWLCLGCVLAVSRLCLVVSCKVSSGKRKNPNWCRAGLMLELTHCEHVVKNDDIPFFTTYAAAIVCETSLSVLKSNLVPIPKTEESIISIVCILDVKSSVEEVMAES